MSEDPFKQLVETVQELIAGQSKKIEAMEAAMREFEISVIEERSRLKALEADREEDAKARARIERQQWFIFAAIVLYGLASFFGK